MTPLTRERRAELLALADSQRLVELGERCLAETDAFELTSEPRVGTLPLEVREPVVGERFLLGDVLAVTAEVELGGTPGWAMRLGDDRVAVLAAAICDAEAERQGPCAGDVELLCLDTQADAAAAALQEWEELSPTVVEFEELV